MAAVVDYVSNWAARLQSRLYVQFKDKPNWNLMCTDVLGPQFQALEDAAQTLLALLDIDNAKGVVLDLIGRIVGQPRGGVDDVTYRLYLRARIRANRSSGSPEDIYAVFVALLGLALPGSMRITTVPFAAFVLRINVALSHLQSQVALIFLRDSKDAGKRAILEWQEQPDAQTFTFGTTAPLRAAVSAGASSLPVSDASLFPASGSVRIDDGLAGAETVAFTAVNKTGGAWTLTLSGTTANSHSLGASVELVGDPGLGWGDVNNAATGGAFAGATQA